MVSNITQTIDKILHNQKCISLSTYKENGEGVPTPVWFAKENNDIYIMTEEQSWKAKRIKKSSKVAFVSCSYRGKIRRKFKDLRIVGKAEFLEQEESKKTQQRFAKKYWALYRFFRNKNYVFLKISPTAILKEPDAEEACED